MIDFFKGYCRYPNFKSRKHHKQSYLSTIRGRNIRLNHNQRVIKLPKIGWVKCKTSVRHIENERIMSVTVKRNARGQFYIALLVTSKNQTLPARQQNVGIDLSISDLSITSDGQKFESQKLHLKYKKQLYYWEKRLARRRIRAKAEGIALTDAKNHQKARRQVARIHEKIANTRKDYIHKITTDLVENYDVIVIEDLKTVNMLKNHKLARNIAGQSWRQFRTFLGYKCKAYGKTLTVINPFKTSQKCSACGFDSDKKTLNIRKWSFPNCHVEHDRDINAAKNIKHIGLEQALVK